MTNIKLTCTHCGSDNVHVQLINKQELMKIKEKKSFLWWALIGWWWIPIKWFFLYCILRSKRSVYVSLYNLPLTSYMAYI